jgi:2-keto-3-deoxy-L-arabinonate dehydratase
MCAIEGVLPVLPMPFDEDGEIDTTELGRVAEYLVSQPIRAIAFGFASEVSRLTDVERDRALREVADTVGGVVPVVATIQAHSTVALLRRGEASLESGATMLMVTPPAGGPFEIDDLVAHFDIVGTRVGVPMIIQDAPTQSGVVTPVDALARLAAEIHNVVAVKVEAPPTAPKVSALVKAVGANAGVLGGAGGVDFVNELERGASGVMPGAAVPELFVRVFDLHRGGRRDEARTLFHRMSPILLLGGRDHQTFCYVQKAILQRRGILHHVRTRSPSPPLDPELDREIDVTFEDAARRWPELGMARSS